MNRNMECYENVSKQAHVTTPRAPLIGEEVRTSPKLSCVMSPGVFWYSVLLSMEAPRVPLKVSLPKDKPGGNLSESIQLRLVCGECVLNNSSLARL